MDKFKERPFTSEELERIREILNKHAERAEPKDFQVLVDELTVIERTDEPSMFDEILDHVRMDSDYKVEIRLYYGRSNRAFRYYLYLERNRPKDRNGNGLEGIEARFDERTAKMRLEWDHDQLRREHDKLRDEHKELQTYSDQLEKDNTSLNERVSSRKFHWGDVNMAELGGVIFEGMVRRNTGMLSRIPGGAALAGLIEEDNLQQMEDEEGGSEQEETESGGGFASMDDAQTNPISREDQAYLEMLRQIRTTFSKEDFLQVMAIIDTFTKDPSTIPIVAELLYKG